MKKFLVLASLVLSACDSAIDVKTPTNPEVVPPTMTPVAPTPKPTEPLVPPLKKTSDVVVNGKSYKTEVTECVKHYDDSYTIYVKTEFSSDEKMWIVLRTPEGITRGTQKDEMGTGIEIQGDGDARPSIPTDYNAWYGQGECSFTFSNNRGTLECQLEKKYNHNETLGEVVKVSKFDFYCSRYE